MTNMHGSDDSPFFITGTQRSGTTLLCRILHMHSRIWTRNELRWRVFELLTQQPNETGELRMLLADLLELPADFSIDASLATNSDAMNCFASAMSNASTKKRWCFKDPHLTHSLELFRSKFPNAKFIILIRDPRATVSSYLKQRWYVANAMSGAELWLKEVTLQQEFAARYPEQCLFVRYESLLEELPATLRSVCEFLGESYESNLEKFHEQESPFGINSSNENTNRPLQTNFIDKWKKSLSSIQIDAIESIVGSHLELYKYERFGTGRSLGTAYRMSCRAHQWIMTNYWWQKRARITPLVNKLRGSG